MLDLPSRPLAEVDPEFERMALETGELTYDLAGTSPREKLMQNLANDICRLHLGLAFELHVQAALSHGIGYPDLLALLRFTAPYAGYPAAADALGRLARIAGDLHATSPATPNAPSSDEAPDDPRSVSPPSCEDAWMRDFLRSRVSRAWSEDHLTRRERAIIAITTDVSQQTLGPTLAAHVAMGREAGMNVEHLRDTVRFCAEMGLGRALAALAALEDVLSSTARQTAE